MHDQKKKDTKQKQSSDQVVANELDNEYEGRLQYEMDIDRMINEGLGGGIVSINNGLIEETTTDTMDEL